MPSLFILFSVILSQSSRPVPQSLDAVRGLSTVQDLALFRTFEDKEPYPKGTADQLLQAILRLASIACNTDCDNKHV
jgi:hypothetical protein